MAIKDTAAAIRHYAREMYEDGGAVWIIRGAGNFRVDNLEVDGHQIVISGKAFDESHGYEVIVERYDRMVVIEFEVT